MPSRPIPPPARMPRQSGFGKGPRLTLPATRVASARGLAMLVDVCVGGGVGLLPVRGCPSLKPGVVSQGAGTAQAGGRGGMARVRRGRHRYYCRSERRGDTVRQVRYGKGELAELAADLDALRRLDRQTRARAWRDELAC